MCGFVGFFNNSSDSETNGRIIRDMADKIAHRGPNQDDYFVDDDVSLGFRRLSIIDLEGGSQPIYNEDRTKVLVFNGEIYNYQTLREDLIKKVMISAPALTLKCFFTAMRNMVRNSLKNSEECTLISYGI